MMIDTFISGVDAGRTTNPFVLVEYCKQGAMAYNIVMRRDLATWKNGQQLINTYLWHNNVVGNETLVRVASILDQWLVEKREELLDLVENLGHVYLDRHSILFSRDTITEDQLAMDEVHHLKRFNFKTAPFWILVSKDKDGLRRAPIAVFDTFDLGDFLRYQL